MKRLAGMLRIFQQYYPIRNILFYFIEGCVIFGSVLLSSVLLTFSPSYLFDFMLFIRIFLVTMVCQIALYYNDLYDFQVASNIPEITIRLLQSLGVSAIVLAGIYYVFPLAIIGQGTFALSIVFLLVFIIGWRMLYIIVLNKGFFNKKVIILGGSDLAFDIYREVEANIDCGYTITVLMPESESDTKGSTIPSDRVMTTGRADLCRTALDLGVEKVVVALKESRGNFPTKNLLACRTAGMEVLEGNSFYEQLTGKLLVKRINPSWLIFSSGFRKSRTVTALKRLSDIVMSVALLILLAPLFLVTAIALKLDSKGPVFFSQDRVGQNKKEYMMHKFRSMVADAEKKTGPVWARDNDDRITRVGRIIRKVRIDELPQLWNVLIGNMSMVGPRPERKHFTDELEEKIPYYSERFVVKPGITGWAQVCYDYGASIEDAVEKLNYDLFYIKNLSLMMDLMIILRTIKTVLFGKGAR